MFAYCGNNPIFRVDSTGNLWWVPGLIGAGISFISTLIFGGNIQDACISAVIGFGLAYLPEEILHLFAGGIGAIEAWLNGANFLDGLGQGLISFLVSYVSGDVLLAGTNASNFDKYAIDLTFGFGAQLIGDALSTVFLDTSGDISRCAVTNNTGNYSQNEAYIYNYYTGGGSGGVTRYAELY